jgi:hypothetical protein
VIKKTAGGIQLNSKLPEELKNEITTYLTEIKTDLENYLTWAMSELSVSDTPEKASEVVEDTMHRLMTITYYLATFFEDADPSHVIYDMASEVADEQSNDAPLLSGMSSIIDPPNRTRH